MLACDLRFASRQRAIFGQPEVGVGLPPGGGALEWLPRLVGRSRALEIVLSGDDFDADLAERYGWINRALDDDALDAFVDGLAARLAGFDRETLAELKAQVNRVGVPSGADLETSNQLFWEALKRPAAQARRARLLPRWATANAGTSRLELPVVVCRTSIRRARPDPSTQEVVMPDFKLEAVVVPVSDVDRAAAFYRRLGWRVDADIATPDGGRILQFTPPGSPASILIGTGLTPSAPGTARFLHLIVSDIVAARADLIDRGVKASAVFHDARPAATTASTRPRGPRDPIRSGAATPRS